MPPHIRPLYYVIFVAMWTPNFVKHELLELRSPRYFVSARGTALSLFGLTRKLLTPSSHNVSNQKIWTENKLGCPVGTSRIRERRSIFGLRWWRWDLLTLASYGWVTELTIINFSRKVQYCVMRVLLQNAMPRCEGLQFLRTWDPNGKLALTSAWSPSSNNIDLFKLLLGGSTAPQTSNRDQPVRWDDSSLIRIVHKRSKCATLHRQLRPEFANDLAGIC